MAKAKAEVRIEPATLRVAYHAGPPEIGFAGMRWRRGVAQEVTAERWAAMQARGDFNEFAFQIDRPEEPAEE